eukprot:scaffold7344_cov242-Pinguiococcus_pyrenoidosus.AAC.3
MQLNFHGGGSPAGRLPSGRSGRPRLCLRLGFGLVVFILIFGLFFFFLVFVFLLGVVILHVFIFLQAVNDVLKLDEHLRDVLHSCGVKQEIHPHAALRASRICKLRPEVVKLGEDLVALAIDESLLEAAEAHVEFALWCIPAQLVPVVEGRPGPALAAPSPLCLLRHRRFLRRGRFLVNLHGFRELLQIKILVVAVVVLDVPQLKTFVLFGWEPSSDRTVHRPLFPKLSPNPPAEELVALCFPLDVFALGLPSTPSPESPAHRGCAPAGASRLPCRSTATPSARASDRSCPGR